MYALVTAHALHPRAAAYTELGMLLKARGQTVEAREALELALRFTPAEPAAYRHLAQLQPSRALSLLRSAARLSPSDGGTQASLIVGTHVQMHSWSLSIGMNKGIPTN